ncbi:hypothetical protein FHU38_000519 [Saccharomonospora amisosensis]|uniref:Uncharacterized protein n=1 Tax=Saccharomonospora amisosensis TaxID=1128677 RepID=A0A7X5ULG6_9PSEU|nr:hypothetical protein [Saccharomonospora amisosensis]
MTTEPARRAKWHRLGKATLLAALALVLVGVPTDIIANPVFSREVPVRWWEYPVLAATVLLTWSWFAIQAPPPQERESRRPLAGVVLSVFAVGCPVCNKLVLLALGTSGALGIWAPVQPFLALISIGLLGAAVAQRWRRRDCDGDRCGVPEVSQPATPRQ